MLPAAWGWLPIGCVASVTAAASKDDSMHHAIPSTKRRDTMKAIVQDTYGSPEVLELRDIDKPAVGDDEVLVRVRAAAVNPADWAIMRGLPYTARVVYGGCASQRTAFEGRMWRGG